MPVPRRGPGSGPMSDRAEATRRAIMEVAAAAFAREGYSGASLNDIIKEAGTTKGGFYFHFPSKEDLALAVLRHKQEQWAGRVVAAGMRYERAVDRLRAMPGVLCDLYEEDPSARSIHRICQELAEDRSLAPKVSVQFTTWIDLTTSVVRAAQEEGSVRDDIDAGLIGEILVTSFMGLEMMSDIVSGGADLRERADRLVQTFGAAFLTPQS
jgi:AcrR family transcriptional regulator